MPRISADLLMYRVEDGKLQMLLAHPGSPDFSLSFALDFTGKASFSRFNTLLRPPEPPE